MAHRGTTAPVRAPYEPRTEGPSERRTSHEGRCTPLWPVGYGGRALIQLDSCVSFKIAQSPSSQHPASKGAWQLPGSPPPSSLRALSTPAAWPHSVLPPRFFAFHPACMGAPEHPPQLPSSLGVLVVCLLCSTGQSVRFRCRVVVLFQQLASQLGKSGMFPKPLLIVLCSNHSLALFPVCPRTHTWARVGWGS